MDKSVQAIVKDLKGIEHGFKHIIEAGDMLLSDNSIKHFDTALFLFEDESYQARMLAVYLLGALSAQLPEALAILENRVAADGNWRVQEMLAKAFDAYCQKTGYEASLPKMTRWLSNSNPNVKRAVIEGLRIWTGRPYFRENPEEAVRLISRHRSDESEYLRKSVGNALRDIQKKFPAIVQSEISTWYAGDKKAMYTKKLVEK